VATVSNELRLTHAVLSSVHLFAFHTVSVGEENHKLWHYNEGPSSSVMSFMHSWNLSVV